MFDTIQGLPLHPLIVHAVVVLGPLAALLLLGYAAVPRWRRGLRIPVLALSLISAASAFVAVQAGEALAGLSAQPGFEHEEKGERAFYALLALAVATILVVLLAEPAPAPARTVPAVVIALVAAVAAIGTVVAAGHSGAQSVWQGRVSAAAPLAQPPL